MVTIAELSVFGAVLLYLFTVAPVADAILPAVTFVQPSPLPNPLPRFRGRGDHTRAW